MSDEVKTDETEAPEIDLESNNIDKDALIDEAVKAIDQAVDEEEKVKMGRPSAYEPEYHNKVVHALARAGLSEDVIASEIGISRATMFNWKKKYPDFLNAISAGKEEADDIVKASLYQRATGYDHKAVKIFMPANADSPVYAPYVEHVPPDVGAIKMWLTNRKPKDWKDKVDVAVDGNMSIATLPDGVINELDPEVKAALALGYAKALGVKSSSGE
jgi:hypothetical protein